MIFNCIYIFLTFFNSTDRHRHDDKDQLQIDLIYNVQYVLLFGEWFFFKNFLFEFLIVFVESSSAETSTNVETKIIVT